MQGAEKRKFIVDDQYRGRTGRTAINPVMITTTLCETFHLHRANAGRTDCNAEACYDCVLPDVVSIVETNEGAPERVSRLMARTLKQMKYHVTTTKGISEEYNSHSQEEPMYGSGQGTTGGRAKWTFKDNVITKTYNKKVTDCRMNDPTKSIIKKQNSARFVDDVTKLHNAK
eukprot:14629170-Ditylum_brightwellii.AAC.1